MAALATDATSLMDAESWLPPEPPNPPGGTRLPFKFGALAQERMNDLVSVSPSNLHHALSRRSSRLDLQWMLILSQTRGVFRVH